MYFKITKHVKIVKYTSSTTIFNYYFCELFVHYVQLCILVPTLVNVHWALLNTG